MSARRCQSLVLCGVNENLQLSLDEKFERVRNVVQQEMKPLIWFIWKNKKGRSLVKLKYKTHE